MMSKFLNSLGVALSAYMMRILRRYMAEKHFRQALYRQYYSFLWDM